MSAMVMAFELAQLEMSFHCGIQKIARCAHDPIVSIHGQSERSGTAKA